MSCGEFEDRNVSTSLISYLMEDEDEYNSKGELCKCNSCHSRVILCDGVVQTREACVSSVENTNRTTAF